MCGLINDSDWPKARKHHDLERAEIKKVDKDHLYSLASGGPTSSGVEVDILHPEEIGKKSKDKLIQDHFVNESSEAFFFEPIK